MKESNIHGETQTPFTERPAEALSSDKTEMDLKKTGNILRNEMYAGIILSVIISALFEGNILLDGILAGYGNSEFLTLSVLELLTICMIPLALRLFKFRKVKESLMSGDMRYLLKWGSLRMMMLCLPMIMNTLTYYLFMDVAFGYMGIICLICLIFIYPGTERCISETGGKK